MRLPFVLVTAACALIFVGSEAGAKPFCEKFPEAPICDPTDPDPCDVDPSACPEPEPDPCEADPAACEPEPVDFSHLAELRGPLVVKGKGLRNRERGEYGMLLNEERFSMATKSWSLDGTLSPLNDAGTKFQLFLDSGFDDAFATFVFTEVLPEGTALPEEVRSESLRMILKLRPDGTAVLRIQGDLLLKGTDAIHFKANLSGPVGIALKG
jgi:hypothetical protein